MFSAQREKTSRLRAYPEMKGRLASEAKKIIIYIPARIIPILAIRKGIPCVFPPVVIWSIILFVVVFFNHKLRCNNVVKKDSPPLLVSPKNPQIREVPAVLLQSGIRKRHSCHLSDGKPVYAVCMPEVRDKLPRQAIH